jgi:hypothetical protein
MRLAGAVARRGRRPRARDEDRERRGAGRFAARRADDAQVVPRPARKRLRGPRGGAPRSDCAAPGARRSPSHLRAHVHDELVSTPVLPSHSHRPVRLPGASGPRPSGRQPRQHLRIALPEAHEGVPGDRAQDVSVHGQASLRRRVVALLWRPRAAHLRLLLVFRDAHQRGRFRQGLLPRQSQGLLHLLSGHEHALLEEVCCLAPSPGKTGRCA